MSWVSKVIILVFSGLLAMELTSLIFMLFFVPIIGAYIWDNHNRTKALETGLSRLEKPSEGNKAS